MGEQGLLYLPALIPERFRHAKPDEYRRLTLELSRECGVSLTEVKNAVRSWLTKRGEREEEFDLGDYTSLGYRSVMELPRLLRQRFGPPPEGYLRSRGLWPLINNESRVVRSLAEFGYRKSWQSDGKKGHVQHTAPALVAFVSTALGPTAIQALILDRSLTWAETESRVKDVKIRVTEGRIFPEAAVRLAPVRDVLAIAEGLETAMSYTRLTGTPCWARLGEVASFVPPPSVRKLIMVHDGDQKADKSWIKLNRRLKGALNVVYHKADEGDMNDMWRRHNGEG